VKADDAVFGGPGEMRRLLRAIDWATTSLGPAESWPPEARSVIAMTLGMASPATVLWGPDYTYFYNDVGIPVMGEAHPAVAGRPLGVAWPHVAAQLAPILESVRATGESLTFENLLVHWKAGDGFEERYFTVSYSPVPTEKGIGGIFCPYVDTTEVVLSRRRTATLVALAAVPVATKRDQAFASLVDVLGKNPHDLPFVLAYAIDHAHGQAQLKATAGIDQSSAMAPKVFEAAGSRAVWPLTQVIESRAPLVFSDLVARFGEGVPGPWDEPTNEAILLPLGGLGDDPPSGVLVVGLNRRRRLDVAYREFLDLVASQVSAAIISAHAFETDGAPGLGVFGENRQAKVLVADDNPDMRDYLGRLLARHWAVEAVADGQTALSRARQHPPDLILADVMMPGLDGFGLLRELRADSALSKTPIVLLSARAGEESRVEGMAAGADDYLVKPLSARELVTRVGAHLELARQRRHAEAALRESEAHLATELEDARVLQKLSNELVSEGGPQGHYGRIVEVARTLMRSDAASIQELDAADSQLKLLAHTGFHPESAEFWASVDADVGSACGLALTAQKRVVVPDIDKFEAGPHDIAAFRKSGIMSVQSTPLVASSGRIVGMMSTHWNHAHTPSAESYRLFDILAHLAADFMERARTEAVLREREARFRTVFETMIEACCIFEMIYDDLGKPVDWRILEANAGYERESGLKDVAGKLASDVMPGTEPYWLEAFARVVETGEPEQIENWHQPTLRWIHSSTARVGGPGNNRLLSVFYDITERKRVEATSREREERQAFLLELSDALRPLDATAEIQGEATRLLREHLAAGWCFYIEWDEADARGVVLRDATRDGLPSLAGTHDVSEPAFLDMLRKGNVLNVRDYASFDALSPELRARYTTLGFRSMLVATLVKQERLVASLLLGDTEVRDWSGDAEALLMEVAERTWAAVERARAEAALRESEERFRMLADNIAQLAWTCDALGNVTWYNQRWLDYTGSSFDEMKGWSWKKVLHPDHVERVVAGVKRSDATGRPWTDTFPLRGKDGQYRWFLSRAIPIHDQQSEIACWFGTNTDVTELREANRAKDEFLAMLGHELRNPLAPIVSTLELMRLEGGRKFEKEREMMLRQARHLAALLDDLLDVARLARGKIELNRSTVALDEMVARAVEAAGPLIEQRRHELHVDVAPGLFVAADEKRIVQVISNLLNNAAHYTPPSGHIFISGERRDRSVVLRVRDDGVGIAPKLLPHVFERFQQGLSIDDRSERGLGVGLAIVRSLVELHGGTVLAASEGNGKGSEFTVHLPARARRFSTLPAAAKAPSNGARAAKHRILLVDDNRNIADVLAMLLVKSGNIVEKAYDASSALSVANTFQPTVAILDIGLPDLSGYELAKRLRKQKLLANIQLIALTGYGGSINRQRSKRAGFAEHLPKPVELEDILASIQRISAPRPAKTSRAHNATRAKPSKPRASKVAEPSTTKSRPPSRKKRRG
jgi:PAS domain S-box-containing protein